MSDSPLRLPAGSRLVRGALVLALLSAGVGACEEEPGLQLPAAEQLEDLYGPGVSVELKGNVVDVVVRQPADQLRRGGSTWAKVGPYIYLFSPQTQKLFEDFSGLGGVRVTTLDGRDRLVARALLPQGTLNSVTWKKALGLAGRARLEGTQRPTYILELIDYGEDLVEHEYGSNYVRDRQ
jgi:hypothetical protein